MYEELYMENKGLINNVARRYATACARDRAVSVEDLAQAGFFGLVKASRSYVPEKGGSWASWAAQYIAREIHIALGLRDGKPIKAHTGALSLDAPLRPDDPDSETGIDELEDTSLPAADEALELQAIQEYVRNAVQRLQNDQQRIVIQMCALEGKTYEAAASVLGVSTERVRQIRGYALRKLRADRELLKNAAADIEMRTPYYCHVGVERFRSTNTSATEHAALWRLERQHRYEAERDRLDKLLVSLG